MQARAQAQLEVKEKGSPPHLKYFAGLNPSCARRYSMRLDTAVVWVRSRFFWASDLVVCVCVCGAGGLVLLLCVRAS